MSRGSSFVQQALARVSGLETVEVGDIVDARPDVFLSHDNTAAIRQIWLGLGQERLPYPERHAITLDHAVPAPTTRHAQNHAEVRAFVAEQGIGHFFEVGDGICHQVLSEDALVLPGQVILGADSHTPHFGWMGALGAGIGRTEMAALWATGELWLRVPESIRLEITGELSPWVSAKDIALRIIGDLGADGGLYMSVEFAGSTVEAMELSERMVLANMSAEMGAKCSYVAPDEATFAYLAEGLQRREGSTGNRDRNAQILEQLAAGALYSEPGTAYVLERCWQAESLRPQVSCPHSVENTVDVDALRTIRVNQAFIGTCTNGRLEDLEIVHEIVRGRRLAVGTRLLIVPASRRIFEEAARRGWVADLIAAGADFATPGCGPCMGNHMGILAPGEVCLSSANRNFQGRMGTREAEIYLASPAVVAASAIVGHIVTPEEVMS